MNLSIASLRRTISALAIAALVVAPATAAPSVEGAAQAARNWAKAVTDGDVEAQMNLSPKRLFTSPESKERARQMRLHDKEVAKVNGERYLSFETMPAAGSGQVGAITMVVIPYRAVIDKGGTKLERMSTLLALAEESGDWSIMEGAGQNPKSLRFIVPGYAGVPRIPPATSKVLKD